MLNNQLLLLRQSVVSLQKKKRDSKLKNIYSQVIGNKTKHTHIYI